MRDWKLWAKAAGVRAVKTFCQSAVALIPAGVTIAVVDWRVVIGTAALAAVAVLVVVKVRRGRKNLSDQEQE